ncbi:uncharacterized protein SAPINGB_P005423 [Magnusiomyces paraingens]|uniref:Transcription activator GCR1-like domain-containing protein n=1 Tax=Magnusiomyces paraingens TaxID=2606893 RepID=A0A5E8C6X5_9ASCO|nr:uncharacterized protein SAPINGB_P005423 [Saprochaete ingens]VVT56936.1 unnamed protein product [Saprochaete ingens]
MSSSEISGQLFLDIPQNPYRPPPKEHALGISGTESFTEADVHYLILLMLQESGQINIENYYEKRQFPSETLFEDLNRSSMPLLLLESSKCGPETYADYEPQIKQTAFYAAFQRKIARSHGIILPLCKNESNTHWTCLLLVCHPTLPRIDCFYYDPYDLDETPKSSIQDPSYPPKFFADKYGIDLQKLAHTLYQCDVEIFVTKRTGYTVKYNGENDPTFKKTPNSGIICAKNVNLIASNFEIDNSVVTYTFDDAYFSSIRLLFVHHLLVDNEKLIVQNPINGNGIIPILPSSSTLDIQPPTENPESSSSKNGSVAPPPPLTKITSLGLEPIKTQLRSIQALSTKDASLLSLETATAPTPFVLTEDILAGVIYSINKSIDNKLDQVNSNLKTNYRYIQNEIQSLKYKFADMMDILQESLIQPGQIYPGYSGSYHIDEDDDSSEESSESESFSPHPVSSSVNKERRVAGRAARGRRQKRAISKKPVSNKISTKSISTTTAAAASVASAATAAAVSGTSQPTIPSASAAQARVTKTTPARTTRLKTLSSSSSAPLISSSLSTISSTSESLPAPVTHSNLSPSSSASTKTSGSSLAIPNNNSLASSTASTASQKTGAHNTATSSSSVPKASVATKTVVGSSPNPANIAIRPASKTTASASGSVSTTSSTRSSSLKSAAAAAAAASPASAGSPGHASSPSSPNTNHKITRYSGPEFKFIFHPKSFSEIWNEYKKPILNKHSIQTMDNMYGDTWTNHKNGTYWRRRYVWRAIEYGLSKGYTVQQCIDLLEQEKDARGYNMTTCLNKRLCPNALKRR